MHKDKSIKLCFAASSGGHLEELMVLRPLMEKYNGFIVTEKTGYAVSASGFPVYYLKQVNRREFLFIFKMLGNSFRSLRILHREKPDVIITTGVLAMIPICLLMKLKKKKLIFIESFAKVNTPTLTGRLLYKYADRFYVQWENMLNVYPRAIYKGALY